MIVNAGSATAQRDFDRVYRDLLDGSTRHATEAGEDELLGETQRKIELAIATSGFGESLRSDATYFLFVNMYHMVVIPISRDRPHLLSQIFDSIPSDVMKILAAADQYTVEHRYDKESGPYISGHAVMEGWARSWEILDVMAEIIWRD
jgi:hypothetical protein